ncbi:DMT family transporter [Brumimicrobium mesophilum]|uniref:DMT family transporter n=1 Tax=Brumimicrobium mesophilum TaxID=392717 RepID=UPI000D1429C5|nr:DMT family transporter [Brumimicrobium mesophilum]
MFYLLLSILSSTFILVFFRMFERFKINVFQSIVYNYITACIVGFIIFGDEWKAGDLTTGNWIPYAFILGALFIGLFLLMGKSAQENGIGITSVTVKMSLVIPVIAAIFLYNEEVYWTKIIGILAALVGVFLITYQKKVNAKEKGQSNILYLILLFLGSGLADLIVNYVEKVAVGDLSLAIFSAILFGVAASIGSVIMLVKKLKNELQLQKRAILGGILLGIPNFFSIYFLMMAIRFGNFSDSITYAMNNTGVVISAFIVGILFFKESTTPLKIIGGVVSIAAILLLTL